MDGLKVKCPFCEASNGEKAEYIIYQDSDFIVLLDEYPASYGHTLVLPRKHYERLAQMPSEQFSRMFQLIQRLSIHIMERTGATGSHINLNDGKSANQFVPHLHVHIIPRNENDEASRINSKILTAKELKDMQDKIRLD